MRVLDLLEDPGLELELAATAPIDVLTRSVTGCVQSELIDPAPYLARGDFLLTLGMSLHVRDQRTWDAYIERLTAAGVSGLGFGLGLIHAEAPDGLIAACERAGLPLIVLSADFPLLKLSRQIWQTLAAERYTIARSGWGLADDCIQLATDGALLPALLHRVAAAVRGNVSLLDEEGFVIASAVGETFAPGAGVRTTLRLPGTEHALFTLLVETGGETMLLQPLLGPACAVIAMQLSYTLTARSPLHSHTAARFFESLLDARPADADSRRELAVTAGFTPDDPWDAVVLRRPLGTTNAPLRLATMRLRVILEQHYGRVRFFDELEHASLLMQHPHGATSLREALMSSVAEIDGVDVAYADSLGFEEIAPTLQAGRRARTSGSVHRLASVDLATIVDSLPQSGLLPLAQRALAPLEGHDETLPETLTAFLELSGSTRAICDRLRIHRNTLAYRMTKIESLLGMDLSDGRTRATLLLALQVTGTPAGRSAQTTPSFSADRR